MAPPSLAPLISRDDESANFVESEAIGTASVVEVNSPQMRRRVRPTMRGALILGAKSLMLIWLCITLKVSGLRSLKACS